MIEAESMDLQRRLSYRLRLETDFDAYIHIGMELSKVGLDDREGSDDFLRQLGIFGRIVSHSLF